MQGSENVKKIVFFGAGAMGRLGLYYAGRSGMKVDMIVDNGKNLWGEYLEGVPVVSPDTLRDGGPYTIIITVGYEFFGAIQEQLTEMGFLKDVDFFEFYKVFLRGSSGFGTSSGVLDIDSKLELVKSVTHNKLVVDTNENCVYRLIAPDLAEQFRDIYRRCEKAGLFEKYLVKTTLVDKKIASGYPLCFRHEFVPLFTYAQEWSPKMFLDYTLFMIDFLSALDSHGMGWLDGHAFNVTFDKGRFVFFDFDAIRLGKTPCFYLQEFINNHAVILLMMAENLMEKAYLYLDNPGQKISIKDIEGYLSAEKLEKYNQMYAACYHAALDGNIQHCCDLLKSFISQIQFGEILQSGWNGYQNELYEKENEAAWSEKQKAVTGMVRSVNPRTLLDLAGNMGWYEFILCDEMERCLCADLDYNCIDFVYQTTRARGIKNIYPIYLNLVAPSTDYYRDRPIGNTAVIPWRKSAIERFRSEMVLALAVVHHLAFAQQLSFQEIIGQFALYTSRFLIVEFMEREDSVVKPALKNTDFNWYTKSNFEAALLQNFKILSKVNSEPTRVLYLCEKDEKNDT